MAKSINAPADDADAPKAGQGHNSAGLSPEDKRALLLTHIADIRKERAALDAIKAEAAAQSKELGDRFRLAKVELGKTYSRKFIEQEILAPLDRMREGGQREFDEERAFARETFGFPNGPQGELFANAGDDDDTAAQQARWGEHGFNCGLQGMPCEAPEGCPSIFVAHWEHRFGDGQAELGRAWEVRNRLGAVAADPDEDGDEPDEEDAFDPDAQAQQLRKSGFLDTSAEQEAAA